MGIGTSNLGGMMSAMGNMTPSSTATPNTNAQPAPQPMGGKGSGFSGPTPAQQPNFGGGSPEPDPRGVPFEFQPSMPIIPDGALRMRSNPPPSPGFIPQPSIGDFDGRFAQAARDSAGRDPFQGLGGMQRQLMEQMGAGRTGQQITDPATGRNFTIGGPLDQASDTGLAYQRAMEAFNQSNQQNQQQPLRARRGGVGDNGSQVSAEQQTQQRNPYVDQGYFQGRMQQQPFMQQPMMSPYQQPFMQRMPQMGGFGGYGMPQMGGFGGYGMPPQMMGGFGGYGMPQMGGFGGFGMPQRGGFGGFGMPQPMGGKGFNPMMFR
jgi:hypothetical protein